MVQLINHQSLKNIPYLHTDSWEELSNVSLWLVLVSEEHNTWFAGYWKIQEWYQLLSKHLDAP